ncbi:hypothetical protein BH11MYX4_BH11MYX4_10950 [soil metagenome]
MKQGVTFDTGVLIALERRKLRALQIHERLGERGVTINVPWVVLAEWWRGRTDVRETILRTLEVEAPTPALAKLAGVALADPRVKRATTIDAIVMASAALRGDLVYTTDVEDLERLRAFFPSVRVLAV